MKQWDFLYLFYCNRAVFGFNRNCLFIIVANAVFTADCLYFRFSGGTVLNFEIQVRQCTVLFNISVLNAYKL